MVIREEVRLTKGRAAIPEQDVLPEKYPYYDEGCELADSCLNCPFPECIYELPGGKRRYLKETRDRAMARMCRTDGLSVREVAIRYRVSCRTVQRALRSVTNE